MLNVIPLNSRLFKVYEWLNLQYKAKSSANGLVGTGFASRYRLHPRAGFFKRPMGRL